MRVEFQIYALKKKLERELTLNAGEEREIVFKDDE